MKRSTLILVLAFIACNTSIAAFTTGNNLADSCSEYKKMEAGKSYNVLTVAEYIGYVKATADALGGIIFDIPPTATVGQMCAIVGRYLEEHPAERHKTGSILVAAALTEAFPTRK